MNANKAAGFRVLTFLILFAVLMWLVKQRVWRKGRQGRFRCIAGLQSIPFDWKATLSPLPPGPITAGNSP